MDENQERKTQAFCFLSDWFKVANPEIIARKFYEMVSIRFNKLQNGTVPIEAIEFKDKFLNIHKAFNQPDGLCLYEINSKSNDCISYIMSLPLSCALYLQIPFSIYPIQEVKQPDISNIKLIAGSPNPNCSDDLMN